MKFVIGLIISILFSVSCSTARPLRNIEFNPVPDGLSLEKVERAIKLAGASKGWMIKKSDKENTLEGSFSIRVHQITVSIPYSTTNYEINYLNSRNMKYNISRNSIHKNYFHWVRELQKEINIELRRAVARE